MKHKLSLLAVILFCSTISLFAQSIYSDILILKDRTEIICHITEEKADGSITIRKQDGSIMTYGSEFIYSIEKNGAANRQQKQEMDSLKKEVERQKQELEELKRKERIGQREKELEQQDKLPVQRPASEGYKANQQLPVRKKSGFFCTAQIGGLFGVGNVSAAGITGANHGKFFSVSLVAGGRVSEIARIGGGIGVDIMNPTGFIPLFLQFHIAFSRSSFTPYFALNGGYSLSIPYTEANSNHSFGSDEGGVMLSPALGIKYVFPKGMEVNILEFGYRLQFLHYDFSSIGGPTGRAAAHYLSLKAGFTFP